MRRAVLLFVVSINFIISDSSVLVSNENVESTPVPQPKYAHTETETKRNTTIITKAKNNELPKTFLFNGSYVYLEDVVYILKNQNWTEEEQPCLQQTLSLLRNLQNFTLWAVWDWDSIPAQPQGLLFGSRFHLGNYDQCMDAPWYVDHEELRAQYCLADIVLERTDTPKNRVSDPYDPYQSALNLLEYKAPYKRHLNDLIWGICVPAVCERESVTRLFGILLAHSHLGTAGLKANVVVNSCEKTKNDLEYDGPFYSFVALMAVLITVAVTSTILNREGSKYRNIITNAFDLNKNAKSLLTMKKDGFEVLYGIRFLTICVIVICHQFGMFTSGPISNGYKIDKNLKSIFGLLLLHNDLTVDTFFWMSGLLTAVIFTKKKEIKNLPIIIFKRYIRLVVAYAIVIFFMAAVYPYVGTGPLWKSGWTMETSACRKNWWASLLMLGNYIDTENICLIVTWYIPCDFHFFVITMLMYWIYTKSATMGRIGIGLLTIASIITPGLINYLYNLPPFQLFTAEFLVNPRTHQQFHLTYIKSHTRYTSYLVGFFTGYLFVRRNIMKQKISQKWAVLGSLVGLVCMAAVLLSGPVILFRGYTVLESVLYAVLNRPIWACGLTFLVLSCTLGDVPILKSFFSWYPWVPLSRLSYGLYLLHTLIIMRNVGVARNLQQHDNLIQLTLSFGVITFGCIGGLLLWLLAEGPFNNLASLMIANRRPTSDEEKQEANGGHLENNLPPTLQIDSSKV